MLTPAGFISRELCQRKPMRLLAIDSFSHKLANAYLSEFPDARILGSEAPGIDLALISESLNTLDKPGAIILLGGVIRLCPVVLVMAKENHPLGFNDFLKLGMQRWHGPDESGTGVYGFDLHTYKTVPDWLNAKYWAHPERWKP